jgi:thymidine phosphorylase
VAAMLELTGLAAPAASLARATELLDGGAGLEKFREFIEAQGGDPDVAALPWDVLPVAPVVLPWVPAAGVVQRFGCRRLGELAATLGAGRRRQDDVLDLAVGLEVLVRIGDEVDGEAPAARIHARTEADADRVAAQLAEVIIVGDDPVTPPPLVHARVGLASR